MRSLALFILLFSFSIISEAQVNFSEHIAPIIYSHCTKCHRDGEIGPMPLTNYSEVSANGSMIAYVTDIKYMPPWRPDNTYTHFIGENVLTNEEIDLIGSWVSNGMPQGNPDLEPELPVFPTGSQVGVPDLVLTMEQAYTHQGNNEDQYQIFVLPTGLTEDKDVSAIEVRADNKSICHHAILGVDISGTGAEMDAETPEYGYPGFGGFGFDPEDQFFSAWVPGATPLVYPPTLGKKLFAGSDLLMQMHYGPTSVTQTDQTSVNIFFADDPIQRYIITYPISLQDLDVPFLIPPNEVKSFHGTVDVPFGVSLIGIAPHAHLLGKSYKVFATSPNQQDTIPLINIPEWNFNWQGLYAYPNPKHIPAGYKVHCIGTFDNTSSNPVNPNDPPQYVWWGESTTDEMYLCYLQFVFYQNGDENISLAIEDSNTNLIYPVHQLFPSYPNPTSDKFTIGYSLGSPDKVDILLYDSNGRLVKQILTNAMRTPGRHKETFDVDNLAPGIYIYQMRTKGFQQSSQLIIAE